MRVCVCVLGGWGSLWWGQGFENAFVVFVLLAFGSSVRLQASLIALTKLNEEKAKDIASLRCENQRLAADLSDKELRIWVFERDISNGRLKRKVPVRHRLTQTPLPFARETRVQQCEAMQIQ